MRLNSIVYHSVLNPSLVLCSPPLLTSHGWRTVVMRWDFLNSFTFCIQTSRQHVPHFDSSRDSNTKVTDFQKSYQALVFCGIGCSKKSVENKLVNRNENGEIQCIEIRPRIQLITQDPRENSFKLVLNNGSLSFFLAFFLSLVANTQLNITD